ncbi:hypothetical protein G4V03_15110 [Escherichia coli]|nr:hypothetical protein [Escherichia coli]
MPGKVEKRFGHPLPEKSLRRLMDNGAAYAERETRWFARELNLEPGTTAVSRACGMPEWFFKTMREDDIAIMPKPDVRATLINPVAAFGHYNENHPHSAPGYLSLGEY